MPESYSHAGIVAAATDIFKTLESKMIISSFLKLNPSYRIVTCGHSLGIFISYYYFIILGAGTASVLAVILKQKYDNILSFAYGSPLIFDKKLAKLTSSFIYTVAYSNDIICKASPKSMYILKEKMKWCFKNSNLSINSSKWEYIAGLNNIDQLDLFAHLNRTQVLDAQSDFSLNEAICSETLIPVDSDKPITQILPLYPAGKMYFILPGKNSDTVVFRSGYESFNEIVVSLDMIKDHFPYVYSVFSSFIYLNILESFTRY